MASAGDDAQHPPDIPDGSDTDSSDSEFKDTENMKEETMKRLREYEEISQKLLEELLILEAEFEINDMSLGQAEVYPVQLANENAACAESTDVAQEPSEDPRNPVAHVDYDVLEQDKKVLLGLQEPPDGIQTSNKRDPEGTDPPADKPGECQPLTKDPVPEVLNEDLPMAVKMNQEVTEATDGPASEHQQPDNEMTEINHITQNIRSSETEVQEINGQNPADTAVGYQQDTEELQETIKRLTKEKQEAFLEMDDLKDQIRKLNGEIEIERTEGKYLLRMLAKSEKTLKKLSRVSMMVTHEYNEMMQQLEMEQSLRQEAELFAHTMLKEKQAANRQSMILMQNLEPNVMLVHALEEVRKLTISLEGTKQELLAKVVDLESQLAKRPSQEEFELIQAELKMANMEKCDLRDHLKKIGQRYSLLEEKIKVMEEKVNEEVSGVDEKATAAPSPPIPPPVPPPPPPCQSFRVSESPVALIRQRRGMRAPGHDTLKRCEDFKAEAMKEMIERIKHGVVLRPVQKDGQSHSAAANKRKSVINELHGILGTMRKASGRTSLRRPSRKVTENELEHMLNRRRRIVDNPLQPEETTGKQQESNPKDDMTPWSMERSPVLVKIRQKKSSLQREDKKSVLALGDVTGQ